MLLEEDEEEKLELELEEDVEDDEDITLQQIHSFEYRTFVIVVCFLKTCTPPCALCYSLVCCFLFLIAFFCAASLARCTASATVVFVFATPPSFLP